MVTVGTPSLAQQSAEGVGREDIAERARHGLFALRCRKKPCSLKYNQTIVKKTQVLELNIHCLERKTLEAFQDQRSWLAPLCPFCTS